MLSNSERIEELFKKYLHNELTREESAELNEWSAASDNNRELFEYSTNSSELKKDVSTMLQIDEEYGIRKLENEGVIGVQRRNKNRRNRLKKSRYIVAACAFVIFGAWAYIWQYMKKGTADVTRKQTVGKYKNDVSPGGNKAMLTLSTGEIITLDSATNGILAKQGNIRVLKLGNGQLLYSHDSKIRVNGTLYNTVTTPKGGQYEVTLPDGTKVWLNAASSLRFPMAFIDKKRSVELSGEAYFEVAKNVANPFQVKMRNFQVEVIGTHFDIMSYTDEQIVKTSLFEGSVKVSNGPKTLVIKPGQQARIDNSGHIDVIEDENIGDEIAWKEGLFRFKSPTPIKTIMRQVERWYDVELEYKNSGDQTFIATIPRSEPLSKFLSLLEATGDIHFSVDGNKLTVLP